MPKIVDPVARRQAVADAVLRVAARDGLEQASLRTVAAEAGLAVGSVRHYFTSHSELLAFAMTELAGRIDARIRAHTRDFLDPPPGFDRRAATERLFAEFLPLDPTRRQEAAVWLAFASAARIRPELRERAEKLQRGMDELIVRVLEAGTRSGGVVPGLDPAIEARRLSALLDGLTLQAVLQPERIGPDELRAVLRRHLDTLAAR